MKINNMSPDQKIIEMEARIEMLESWIRQFQSAPELDLQIARTITTILSTNSTKTAASATRAVNEAGAATYNVMYAPSGFIRIGDYDVPYI
jgi:DNA transposition AAA+ family ATPase